MNAEQALRARELASEALANGNKEKAARLARKSLSMVQSAEAKEILRRATSSDVPEMRQRRNANGHASGAKEGSSKSVKEAPAGDTRPFNSAQLQAVQRVQRCTDLYEMLEVSRDAGASVIKKAYRKKAVLLHPDKNSAPGSAEAFKEINKAFSILSDPQKRREYDHFGETSDNPAQQFSRRYHADDFNPEDIFREVFGAQFAPGMGGPGVRTYYFGPGGGVRMRRGHGDANAQFQGNSILQLLPLLLLFLMSFASLPLQQQAPFSLQMNSAYPIPMKTQASGIIPDIPYFVDQGFRRNYARNLRMLYEVESKVQEKYVRFIERECRKEKGEHRSRIAKAQRAGNKETVQKEFEKVYKHCQEWERLKQYIRD